MLAVVLEEVAAVGEQRLQSSRLGLRLSAEDLAEFRRRLHTLLDEYDHALALCGARGNADLTGDLVVRRGGGVR